MILLIDDDLFVLEILGMACKHEKLTPLLAQNATEARALLETHHAEIQGVISDNRMPGEQGTELVAWIIETYPHLKEKTFLSSGHPIPTAKVPQYPKPLSLDKIQEICKSLM